MIETYGVDMSPLMFGPIGRIAESFGTAFKLTNIGSFPSMGSDMNFQILEA